MKISVVVPVYNLEKYIERCLRSIQNQTYKDLEIIVVDDGSKDNSANIIRDLQKKDKRITYLYQSNSGVMAARLLGIEKSTGEYIGFVDGDDEIEKDMYELLMNNAIKFNAAISHCGYKMVFSDGRENLFYGTKKKIKMDNKQGIIELLNGEIIEPGLWNKIYKRELFESISSKKGMRNNIKINEDLLMNFYLFTNAEISVFEDVCKYHYIVRENSASRAKLNLNKIYDPIIVKKIILEEIDDSLLQIAKKVYIRTCINIYNELILEKNSEHKKEKKEIQKLILNNRESFPLLDRKQQLLAMIINKSLPIYPCLYRVYVKILQKNKYD